MKRIVLLVCVLVLGVANTAEARRNRRSNYQTYYRPVVAAPATYVPAVTPAAAAAPVDDADEADEEAAAATPAAGATVRTVSYSTTSAQGVANLMAAYSRVGHWGGNPGYEGCGCGATPQAAYATCCYANSGMATVDVGYAQGSNGMWYCCRRYR